MWQTKATVAFTLLSLIFIQGSSGVYWPCETQSDCTAVGSECSSTTNLCECNGFDTVFSEDFTKCLKTSLFGDTCKATVQCNLMPSGANCKSGVCDCADGHQYVRGRCRAANGLDQQCETDLDCYFGYDRQSVTCQNNVCACANGYYRRHSNICRRKAMKIGDACVVDTDCDAIASNVQCKSLKCQYVDELHQLNSLINQSNVPKTNTHTRTRTRTHSQPQSQSQSQSQSQGPTQFNVEAEIALSPATDTAAETPKTETESSSLDFNSSDNTAKASQRSGSTPILVNGNGTDNDEAADDTSTDIDEHEDDNNKSQESQAKANIEHKPLELKRSREIAVQTSIEGFELKDLSKRQFRDVGTGTTSTSTSSRITSHSNNHQQRRRPATGYRFNDLDDDIKTFSTLSNTDEEVPEKYGSACAENGKPCDGLPHSVCSNNICFCKQGYYPKNSKCFAELGEIAESSDECEYDFEETTKKCVCQPNFFYERNLRGCRKPITYNLSCTSNSQCSPFGAAFCKPEIPRRCNCAEFAEYDAFLQMCVFKQGLGAECDRNEGCPVEHSICQNRYCVCKETFFEKDGACVRGLGAECAQNDECKAENSVCEPKTASSDDEPKDRTCQCRKGFVHFKDQCLQEAEDIDDECIETEQCKPLLGTCVDKKCKCTETQQFKNGRCENKKEIGEPCSRAGECFVEKDPENVECRNSVCQCKFGYQPSTEQKTCIRVMPNKKNSSGRPSALKIVTFVLIGSAFLITSAAIKQAYYV